MLFAASLFASNHIAARIAFDAGAGVALAILARSSFASVLMTFLAIKQRASFFVAGKDAKWLVIIGVFIAGQSWALYTAVSMIPVPVALLLVNTWPAIYLMFNWLFLGLPISARLAGAMIVIGFGLFLVLNIGAVQFSLNSDQGLGIALGLSAAMFLASAMWITNHRVSHLPGPVRSSYTMITVALMMVGAGLGLPDSTIFDLPTTANGFLGIAGLAIFYGIASTILFVWAPKLNMAKNAPILNFEPVASLFLSYWFLNQTLLPIQLIGGLLVIIGVMVIGVQKNEPSKP